MVYFYLLDVFLLCPAFFSRISSSLVFFSSFYFTASPLTINRFLFAHDFQQRFTILSSIYLFIYLLPQIHENLITNMKWAILLATLMLFLHQTKGNVFVILPLFILILKLR